MTIDTSIGLDDPQVSKESGIDDEARERKARDDGETEATPGRDLTREDIEAGNDGNVSTDQGNRSGTTNKLHDDGIDVGNS